MNSLHIGLVYALWFFVTFFFMVKNRDEFFKEPKSLSEKEKITILVPAFNEEETIADTIESILRLEYPKNLLEIIVVNDGSSDR
ncbi:MAG: hypothetical protein B6U72_03350 [Candidatus Altiarchaeales archaeon ex4484_2]|nr:MAG: hypothetical protein B6U72_03350 [Candidatus Altiarchaeales archaeon ex4484_2]